MQYWFAPMHQTGCILHHPGCSTPTLFVSAYVPDSSRGIGIRADFWSRLDGAPHQWRLRHPSADLVLGMDSNTWLAELDPKRRDSRDAPALGSILTSNGLRIVSPPGIPTHRSGTVIDVVAVSVGVAVADVTVHGPSCQTHCPGMPGSWSAMGSDHSLVTFRLCKAPTPVPAPNTWLITTMDWALALRSDQSGLAAWHSVLLDRVAVPAHLRQGVLDSLQTALAEWLWSLAASQCHPSLHAWPSLAATAPLVEFRVPRCPVHRPASAPSLADDTFA